jgi:CRP-like cAMP-binding protein
MHVNVRERRGLYIQIAGRVDGSVGAENLIMKIEFPELCHEPRFVFRNDQQAVAAVPAPRQNHLLAALPHDAYARLLPELEPVPLPLGWVIHGAGDRQRYLHFPTAGIVSRYNVTGSGASVEFAVTGREGVIGVASFLGGESMPTQSVVLSAGHSYRLAAGRAKSAFDHDGPLPRLLLRYTLALIAQTGQISACNRRHSVEQRLCRWILSCVDRLPSDELTMTHALIADMLGVRREAVTDAAGKLQHAGLIHCGRGHVAVLDRRGLEARACECYAVIKRMDDRLFPGIWSARVAPRDRPVMESQHFLHGSAVPA